MAETSALPGAAAPAAREARRTDRRVLAAAGVVAAVSIVVKAGSGLRELLIAWYFGTSDPLDAYLVGYAVPYFLVTLLAGSLPYVLVPAYMQVRVEQGAAAASRLASAVLVASTASLLALGLVVGLGAPAYLPLVAYGFAPEKVRLAQHVALVLAPTLVSSVLISMLAALLNAHQRFLAPALSPLISTFVVVAAVVTLGSSLGVDALAYGLLVGTVVEVAWLAWLARGAVALRPLNPLVNPHVRHLGRRFVPTLVGAALMASTLLVDQAMSTGLAPGSVAALNYANRLVTVPLGLTAAALGTAILPHFSDLVARAEWAELRGSIRRFLRLTMLLGLPASIVLAGAATPLTEVLLRRGAFTAADVPVVASCLAALALQVPFYTGVILLMRLALALRLNGAIATISALNLGLNVGLNAWLASVMGVAGIALSTSLVYVCSFGLLLALTRRALHTRGG